MPVNYRQFIHPLDASAQSALEAIPGFKTLCKEFMSLISERMFEIENSSSNVKLGKNQLPEIYNLLPPICEKLGIDIPDLYLTYSPYVNACTFGDTCPIIMINSAMIDNCTLDEIQLCLAHECGHILCHHTLYSSMTNVLLNISDRLMKGRLISLLLSAPIQAGLMHWSRCSEFSADRVSAFFDGGSERATDLLMRLAGGIAKNSNIKLNKDEFLKQGAQYKERMQNNIVDKGFELYQFLFTADHPLNAYRSLELVNWCNSEEFANINPEIIIETSGDLKEQGIEQELIENLTAEDLTNWFRKHNKGTTYTNVLIHCGICNKDFKYLKRLSVNSSKTVYEGIVDKNDQVVKYRLVTYVNMDKNLEDLFIKNDGVIFCK